MLAPAGASVFTFCVPVHEVILLVGSGDVPHLPFPIVINQVRFVHASVFPLFICNERGFWLIYPLLAIPLQKTDRIGPPEVLRSARVVDAFDPFAFVGPNDGTTFLVLAGIVLLLSGIVPSLIHRRARHRTSRLP